MTRNRIPNCLVLVLILLAPLHGAATQQSSTQVLEAKLQKQYEKIFELFANGPGKKIFPADPRERIRLWQKDLADAFAAAEVTIGEILRLHPNNEAYWRERRETMALYSTPVSPPETREVFGKGEVTKRARLINAPAANYPDAARLAKAKGEVRLRLVLAADGSVKYIFPMKRLKYGLTEAAIDAAMKITFEPAIRNSKPASQFLTLSYEFKNGEGRPPYEPQYEFYF